MRISFHSDPLYQIRLGNPNTAVETTKNPQVKPLSLPFEWYAIEIELKQWNVHNQTQWSHENCSRTIVIHDSSD